MDQFTSALVSKYTGRIPPEYDWFAPLVGDWDIKCYDTLNGSSRYEKGEWLFRRILNGTGIQDLFLCPSRDPMTDKSHADGEYGTSIRIFNEDKICYDVTYASQRDMCRLQYVMDGKRLVGTLVNNPSEKWVFSDIRPDSFHFQKMTVLENGIWKANCNIYANRKKI